MRKGSAGKTGVYLVVLLVLLHLVPCMPLVSRGVALARAFASGRARDVFEERKGTDERGKIAGK